MLKAEFNKPIIVCTDGGLYVSICKLRFTIEVSAWKHLERDPMFRYGPLQTESMSPLITERIPYRRRAVASQFLLGLMLFAFGVNSEMP